MSIKKSVKICGHAVFVFFTSTDSHKFSRIIIVAPKMVSALFQRHVVVVVAFVAGYVFKHT